ncbi:MAG: hypothetical protein ACKOCB_03925 [Planctomycetia bacterium]
MFEDLEELAKVRLTGVWEQAGRDLLDEEARIRADAGERGLSLTSGAVVQLRVDARLNRARATLMATLSVWMDIIRRRHGTVDEEAAGFIESKLVGQTERQKEGLARWAREEGVQAFGGRAELQLDGYLAEARRALKEAVLEGKLDGAAQREAGVSRPASAPEAASDRHAPAHRGLGP